MTYVEDSEVSHVVDSAYGIYMFQTFVERFGESIVAASPCDRERIAEDIAILRNGPDDPEYFEAWVDMENLFLVELDGRRFYAYGDEGIYLVREDIEWCEECDWFASAECDCPHIAVAS